MNNKRLFIKLYVMIVMIMVGCSSRATQAITATSDFPSTQITSTLTFLPPTATLPLTRSSSQTLPTLTPFSVLSSEGAKTKLFESLENNSGCRLPCFLGYTPGITTSEEMKQFFDQFVASNSPSITISKPQAANEQDVGFYFPIENLYFHAGISAWEKDKEIVILGMGTFLTGQTEHPWNPAYYETMKYYMLPQVLANYGVPAQVLILTFRDDRQRPDITINEFFLVLLYPEQGIYLKYKMAREITKDKFIGCPSKSYVDIAVWSPQNKDVFNQVAQIMNNGGALSPYKSIDEATSMTLDEFYHTFLNPDNSSCIETPVETWPNP